MRSRMLKVVVIILAASIPAAALAVAGKATERQAKVAKALCKAERSVNGKADFKAEYGKRGAMKRCVRATNGSAGEIARNAVELCAAERAADPDGFKAAYGTDPNLANAFGKCVSSKVGDLVEEEVGGPTMNPAAACEAERAANPEAFAATYGSDPNLANAFGKCVSSRSGDPEEEDEEEEEEELPEIE